MDAGDVGDCSAAQDPASLRCMRREITLLIPSGISTYRTLDPEVAGQLDEVGTIVAALS